MTSKRADTGRQAKAGVKLLAPDDLVKRWDGAVNVRTLANWRSAKPKRGPAYTKIGRGIRYRLADVIKFEAANTARATKRNGSRP